MKLFASGAAATVLVMNFSYSQLPGDRPAANPRATRSVVMGRHGMIATSQPLASAAGLKVLQDGGNAIDAAITAAAVLSVVEPTMNGVGGDLFAIVYDAKAKKLRALNASGRSGYAATPDVFAKRALKRIPNSGVLSVGGDLAETGRVQNALEAISRDARVADPVVSGSSSQLKVDILRDGNCYERTWSLSGTATSAPWPNLGFGLMPSSRTMTL